MTVAVVMGVSGCGKTTFAQGVAASLGWQWQEGDALHPPANVAKMQGGTPLTDEDRAPWLEKIAERIDAWRTQGTDGIVTCSALKRAYRRMLIGDRWDVRLIYLSGDKATIAARLAARRGHFMPPGLLDSQFATLEEPAADEHPVTVQVDQPKQAMIAAGVAALSK